MVNFLDILPDFSRWFSSIFCRESHGEFYWLFWGASRSTLCYVVGNLTVNFLDILWFSSIFWRESHGEFYWHFLGRLTVNFLLCCWKSYGEFSRYFFPCPRWIISIFWGNLTIKYVDILSTHRVELSRYFCLTPHWEYSRYFAGRLMVPPYFS
jgi:hypothetical protein